MYDRSLSGAARFAARRESLLEAAARAFCEGRTTAQRVIELAQVGPNAFYECFDDFEHALGVTRAAWIARVARALERDGDGAQAERDVEHLCSRWLSEVALSPFSALTGLSSIGSALSPAGKAFRAALSQLMSDEAELDACSLDFATCCAELSARELAGKLTQAELGGSSSNEQPAGPPKLGNSEVGSELARAVRALLQRS